MPDENRIAGPNPPAALPVAGPKPQAALRVADLNRSLAFYQTALGAALDLRDDGLGVAQVRVPDNSPMLLALPRADMKPYLADVHKVYGPGARVYRTGRDLPALRDRLAAAGLDPAYRDKEWGERLLTVVDPDGYEIAFYEMVTLPDEEVLAWYEAGPDRLEAALAGLAEADLDLTRAPGKWSIRQIVLHLVDSDATSLQRIKFALAEPGRVLRGNPYDPDVWADGLDYAHRPVAAEVALFRAIRAHVGGLLRHLPGALDRAIQNEAGQATRVRTLTQMLAGHAMDHIEQIWETRRKHDR